MKKFENIVSRWGICRATRWSVLPQSPSSSKILEVSKNVAFSKQASLFTRLMIM